MAQKKSITLLDGSIGQELVKRAGDKPTSQWSTSVMMNNPDIVAQVHSDYFKVGATIATTNTYSVHYDRLKRDGLEKERFKLWNFAVDAAVKSKNQHGSGLVAASIGPLMASYRPDICPSASEAEKMYQEIISVISQKADLLLIETMSSVDQADGALRAAKQCSKPVWIAFSVDDFDGSKLRSGESILETKSVLEQHNPDAVLINCSRPEAVTLAVRIISQLGFKFGAYANGFTKITDEFLEDAPTVSSLERRKDLSPKEYLKFVYEWINLGATIVGGCCEVGPEHIKLIADDLTKSGYQIG